MFISVGPGHVQPTSAQKLEERVTRIIVPLLSPAPLLLCDWFFSQSEGVQHELALR